MEPIQLTERLGRWSSGRGPLHVLLAARLRALIDDGTLPPGAALPPDRRLSAILAVGRSTVVAAYEVLRAEGRIVRRQGSGTRVAGKPATPVRDAHGTPVGDVHGTPVFLHLLEPRDGVILLACAAPDAPPPEYLRACADVLPRLAAITDDIGYYPAGHPALRRAIASYYAGRGVPTEPDEIMVTGGAQQALSLLARAFVRPGERVLVENPSYPGALEAFREEAAVLCPLPVGLAGFEAAARRHRPCLAYAIPTYHNPTGAVLPALHRRRLATTAASARVPLVDDEVIAHLGFPGEPEPPPPLAAYAPDWVISAGSLSKIVWGGLRIGWIRAPVPVISRLARLRAVHDLGGNVLAQLAAAELVPQLDALRRRQAAVRQAGYRHMRAELARHLPDWQVPSVRGGQTLWVQLPRGDGVSFAQAAIRRGVAVLPGTSLDAAGGSEDYLRLHFATSPEVLTEAVRRLATAWRAYDPPKTRVTAPPALAI
jgi:DNA-binding transcriptional MocR family regulator